MRHEFLMELFDVFDHDGFGYIQEDKLGYALEKVGIVVDETALNLMIQVHAPIGGCIGFIDWCRWQIRIRMVGYVGMIGVSWCMR